MEQLELFPEVEEMKDEAAFKRHFKKSVTAQGGFSISLAAPILNGVPDLYVVLPGVVPVLLEAKWMKEITVNTNKQIPLTMLQKHFLDSCNDVHPGVAHCLIGYKLNNRYWATLLNTKDRVVMGAGCPISILTQKELFNVRLMFELYVPKMNYVYKTKPLTDRVYSVNVDSLVPRTEPQNEKINPTERQETS